MRGVELGFLAETTADTLLARMGSGLDGIWPAQRRLIHAALTIAWSKGYQVGVQHFGDRLEQSLKAP